MNYFYDVFGWYVGTSGVNGRSTNVAPENTSTTNQEGELRANWSGWRWVDMVYVQRSPPTIMPTPTEITKYQALLYLNRQGLLSSLETAIQSVGGEAFVAYNAAHIFRRDNPILNSFLKNNHGMTDTQIDQWFIGANEIKE